MDIKAAIQRVTGREDLSREEMIEVTRCLMSGESSDAQNAAFLVGLQMKGVTAAELLGGATVMRELATPVRLENRVHLVDTCGTGGSGSNKFNISTAAALVTAAAGARVAKHGNRGATSKSGSADVLEAAGVRLDLRPEQIADCVEEVGVAFMFAPAHHSAMKHVITARREIGVRTLFNLLGPLTNPAGAQRQVMGVFDAAWIPRLLEVFQELGSEHVLIVASEDGLDEISIAAPTRIGELRDGERREFLLSPQEFGLPAYADCDMLKIDSVDASLAMMKAALSNENQAAADIVALNAGAAIYAAGIEDSLPAGVKKARSLLEGGDGLRKLEQLVEFTKRVGG